MVMAIAQRITFGSWLVLRGPVLDHGYCSEDHLEEPLYWHADVPLVSIFLLLKFLSCYSRTQLEHSTWLTMKMVKFGVTFGVVWGLRESDWIQMEISETVS